MTASSSTKKIGVLLAGCGVYDGSEIHEATFTLLALAEDGAEAVCVAPDVEQAHVVNHLTGEEMPEKRNVLVESARIARGNIRPLSSVTAAELDALIIPGGFGAAKNLNKWAFNGPDGPVLPEVKKLIVDLVNAGKPVCGLCMGPTVIAKALEGSGLKVELTVGTAEEPSPYEIAAISQGMESLGHKSLQKSVLEVAVDRKHKIVTAPCYMMEASIVEVYGNVKQAVDEVIDLL